MRRGFRIIGNDPFLRLGAGVGLQAGGGAPELSIVCPAITPTLDVERFDNPGFEGTYVDGGAPSWSKAGTVSESATAHGGAAAQSLDSNGAQVYQSSRTTVGVWYTYSLWVRGVAASTITLQQDTLTVTALSIPADSTYHQYFATYLATETRARIRKDGANAAIVDDASLKATTTLLSTLLGTRLQRAGTYVCHPTVADNTQCGFIIHYASATNYVKALVDRGGTTDTARLWKYINGVRSEVTSGAITYSAGAELKIVVDGAGNYSLYYAGGQEGTTQAIAQATLGYDVYGFNAFAGNTVGLVTTSPN